MKNENISYKKQRKFSEAVDSNNLILTAFYLENKKINPAFFHNDALVTSCINGYYDMVKLLLSDDRVDPTADLNSPIVESYNNKHYNVVSLLWEIKEVQNLLRVKNHILFDEIYNAVMNNKLSAF
jgi:hypothetical protein